MSSNVLDGIIGLCVGDALGVPVEFVSRNKLAEESVRNMMEYGTHNQPLGKWSDDSSLTFCLMESLCTGYNLQDIANRFVKWYEEGYWTPYGEVFDIGNATLQAISRIKRGCKPVEAGGKTEYDNGNGSLMRILPIAFYLENDNATENKFKIVNDISSITHAHSRSIIACAIYVEMAQNLMRKAELRQAYENMKKTILEYYSGHEFCTELKHFSRLLENDISTLKENDIKSSGYVVHTLEASLWCLLNSKTYSDTVLKAVNMGDDTDTTAAIVGGLAGIYYGLDAIPSEWVNSLARKEDVFKLCEKFCLKIKSKSV